MSDDTDKPDSKVRRLKDGTPERTLSVCITASTKPGRNIRLAPDEQLEAFEESVIDPDNFIVSESDTDKLDVLSIRVLPDFLSQRGGHGTSKYECLQVRFLALFEVRTSEGKSAPEKWEEVEELLRRVWWRLPGLTKMHPHGVSVAGEVKDGEPVWGAKRECEPHTCHGRAKWESCKVEVMLVHADEDEDKKP